MSIAFETSRSSTGSDSNPIQRLGFDPIMWRYNRPPENGRFSGGGSRSMFPPVKEEEEYKNDSCSSSSIGRNSDSAGGGNDADDDGEVQSSMTETFNTLSALEEVLPMKRGISTFYAGKSKSFSNLADAASASIQDISKPLDAYSRKRKNLMAHQVIFDKDRNLTSGMAKRFANSSRSNLAPGLTMNPCSNKSGESSNSNSLPSGPPVPPLPPCNTSLPANESSDPSPRIYCTPWRSLSLSDLQHASSATVCITDSMALGPWFRYYFLLWERSREVIQLMLLPSPAAAPPIPPPAACCCHPCPTLQMPLLFLSTGLSQPPAVINIYFPPFFFQQWHITKISPSFFITEN